jgi:8-oxo-dGTP pyrophosphatase MutT (NUDIX family)
VQDGIPQRWQDWEQLVRQALALEEPIPLEELLLVRDQHGQPMRQLSVPDGVTPRIGAVLALCYRDGDDLRVLLTVRSSELNSHRGEVSLPGGQSDPSDLDAIATALRECQEELGINFQITPIVGFLETLPALTINTKEVSSVISTTLRELLDPHTVVVEPWNLRGYDVMVPFFAVMQQKVWGATALILSDLTARMRRVLAQAAQ